MAYVIPALWLAWLLYWLVAARGGKPVARSESVVSRLVYTVPILAGSALLIHPAWRGIGGPMLPRGPWLGWGGLALVIAGLALTVWARRHLAGNWSGIVTLKEGHELIRSGPYRWLRHPIYSGLILALIGTTLTIDRWAALAGLVLLTAGFLRKLVLEERLLQGAFGAAYRDYRAETWRLVPGLW